MTAFRLQRAGPDDLAAVMLPWLALGEEHARLDDHYRLRAGADRQVRALLRALLRDAASRVVLVEPVGADVGAEAIGLCLTRVDVAPPILRETRRGEISDLWVSPLARRRGIGRALVDDAIAWLREGGISRVEVRVAARNVDGRAFWDALDFAAFVDVLDRRL